MGPTTTLLSLGVFLALLTASFASLTAFDRSAHIILKKHARTEELLRGCQTLGKTERVLATIYKPSKKSVIGYRCDVRYTRVLVDTCGGTESLVSNNTEIISRDACLEAHEIHSSGEPADLGSNYAQLSVRDQRTVHAENHFIDDHNIQTRYVITLSTTTGFIDFENGLVNFGGPDYVCDLDDQSCGGYYWQVPRPSPDEVVYQGTADVVGYSSHLLARSHVYFLVTRDSDNTYVEEVSRVRAKLIEDGSRLFRSTHHPRMFIQISEDSESLIRAWRSIPNLSLSMEEHGLSHVYAEPHFGREVHSGDVASRFCRTEQKELSLMLQSRLESVELFSPVYLRDGIVVTKLNHSVAIGQCAQVKVAPRLTNECFEDIPVYDLQGREAFLHPVNRYFLNCSRITACGTGTVTVPAEDEEATTEPLPTTTVKQDESITEAPEKSDSLMPLFLFGLLLAAG